MRRVTSTDVKKVDSRSGLVQTKLLVPTLRPGLVRRDALLERLLAPDSPPLVSVVAPGGYGKTTVLAQWSEEDSRPFAWLTLDRDDNDIVLLARHAEAALRRAGVLDRDARPPVRSSTVASALRQIVASAGSPFVLVLDDVQELGSTGAHDLVGALSRSLPEGSQLVLSGRRELVDIVAPARAAQRVIEIAPGDLALSRDEGRALLSAVDVGCSDEIAEEYVRHAEGWAAGLYLIALARRGGKTEVGGDSADRFVEDYLWTQHLASLPAEQLTFLLRSSVLDRMCGELCDLALDREGSSRMLDEIGRSNLFLVPLDNEREWYRYHELFRSVLRHELDRTEPKVAAEVRRRASDWCAVHDLPESAMSYAVSVGDTDRMARVIVASGFRLFRTGRLATVAGWLEHFQDGALLARHPDVAVLGTLAHANLGRPFQAERWLDAAAHAAGAAPPPPDGSASFRSWVLTASAFLCREGPNRMLEDAEGAVAELAPFSPLRPIAMWFRATALFLQGDERAETALEEAVDATSSTGANFSATAALCQLATLALDRGDVDRARSLVTRFQIQSGDETFVDYPALALPLAVEARTCLAEGEREEAARLLIGVQRLRPSLSYALAFASMHALVETAHTYVELGEPAAARAVLFDATEMLQHRPDLGILGDRVGRLRQRVSAAGRSADGWELSLTAAEIRLLPLLTTHLTFREIGQRLFVSRNTVKTQAISIYRKLDANSRAEAVARAAELGLVDPEPGAAPRHHPDRTM